MQLPSNVFGFQNFKKFPLDTLIFIENCVLLLELARIVFAIQIDYLVPDAGRLFFHWHILCPRCLLLCVGSFGIAVPLVGEVVGWLFHWHILCPQCLLLCGGSFAVAVRGILLLVLIRSFVLRISPLV